MHEENLSLMSGASEKTKDMRETQYFKNWQPLTDKLVHEENWRFTGFCFSSFTKRISEQCENIAPLQVQGGISQSSLSEIKKYNKTDFQLS